MKKEILLESGKLSSRTFRIFHKDKIDTFFYGNEGKKLRYQLIKRSNILVIWSAGAWGNIADSERWCNPLREEYGYSTFSYDLRGMGRSKGSKFDFVGQMLDLHNGIDFSLSEYKKRYEQSPKGLVIIGHSLGGVASLTVGIQHPKVDLVFALSSIYSLEDLFPKGWVIRFLKSISKNHNNSNIELTPKYYLSETLIKKAYIIHGTKDEFVPYERSSHKIIERFNLNDDQFLILDDGHSFTDENLKKILEWIDSKIKSNIK